MTHEPSLIVDKHICQQNIARMADKARQHGLHFKPHMKTHQSAQIGEWIRDCGVKAITVSSVKMARYFAKQNWNDITIAMPAHPGQTSVINELAKEHTITLLINDPQIAAIIDKKLSNTVQVYIEFDSGAHRTGLEIDEKAKISNLIQELQSSPKLEWVGFYSHPGHSYSARSKEQVKQIHQKVLKQCKALRQAFEPTGREIEICVGDTPCCSVASDFDSIDAISPGNFVFYDLMQHQIGSCKISDIAVAVRCPIIDSYPRRSELIVHGGAIHFSKEALVQNEVTHYGVVAEPNTKNMHWQIQQPKSYLSKLSQEHGTLHCPNARQYSIGDYLTILPVHSCLTANLMGRFRENPEADSYIKQMSVT